jgi:hypothetical protein
MELATSLKLPWRLLREKLAPVEKDEPLSKVHYSKTLEMMDTDDIVSILVQQLWNIKAIKSKILQLKLVRNNHKLVGVENLLFSCFPVGK